MLEKLLEEIERLKLANELLNQVWNETLVYNNAYSSELNQKLQRFFNYDDAE